MATVLKLNKVIQYLETLTKAAADEKVRKALNDFKEQLSPGGRVIIRLPVAFTACKYSSPIAFGVPFDEFHKLLDNLEHKGIAKTNPDMKKAVKGIREKIRAK